MASKPIHCVECGYEGIPQRHTPGSFLMELVLWLIFIIPGLIYSIWRVSNRRHRCPSCRSDRWVFLDEWRSRNPAASKAFCPACGTELANQSRFCPRCGAQNPAAAGLHVAAPPLGPPSPDAPATASQSNNDSRSQARVTTGEPKRAGRLALAAFLVSLVLAIVFGHLMNSGVARGVPLGIGAAYIIFSLLRWNQMRCSIRGVGIGWTVAVFLLICCVSVLANSSHSPSAAASTAPPRKVAETPVLAGGTAGDQASIVMSRCGKPDEQRSTAYENPRPPIVSGLIGYRKANVVLLFVPDSRTRIGEAPPYHWEYIGATDMAANVHSRHALAKGEPLRRLPCLKAGAASAPTDLKLFGSR